MQISRKCKHYIDWCAAGVIADTWKSWGFMDAYTDGEIEPNPVYTGETYPNYTDNFIHNQTDWHYKWKYDLTNSYNYFYFCNRFARGNVNDSYARIYFNLTQNPRINTYLLDNNGYDSQSITTLCGRIYRRGTNNKDCVTYSNYYNMFFIPLKNNGFFYNREAISPYDNAGNYHGGTLVGCPEKLTLTYKQLSPYLWDLYSYRRIANTYSSQAAQSSFCSVIGFFNNITNKMNYITLVVPDTTSVPLNAGVKTIYIHWDHKDGAISTSIPYMDSTGEYTDVKENICTLIKYPYDDGALSNLFLISTCPQRKKRSFMNEIANDACGLEGKFFSFNGRNFYGFYNNLAVELPSN